MNTKLIIALGTIVGVAYAISNASFILNFPDVNTQSFADKFSLVHFTAPGNDFVGSFFRLPSKSVSPMTIRLGSSKKICTKLVKGLYFNSQRGKRIWPLDAETLNILRAENSGYNNLELSGGLYTSCDSGSNYGIFGAITYTRGGRNSYLVAGTKLRYQENKIMTGMSNSFQYFDNKVPMGYIYDSNGGIGYVGGILSGDENLIHYLNSGGSINSGFIYSGESIVSRSGGRMTNMTSGANAMETMRNIIIQGSVGLSKSIDAAERLSLLGNFQNKTIIYNGSDINSSTLINLAKQKAQTLCAGKETNLPMPTSETLLCYENTDLTINLDQGDEYKDKTIIVRSGNVILQGGMQEDSPALDLFLDRGLLYLPDTISAQTFDDQGFPSSNETVNAGLYLKGNFIINGLIVGGTPGFETGFNHTLHIQGKITTLNTPLQPNTGKTSQIEAMFETDSYDGFINLQNVFVWTCGFAGKSSDGSLCSTGGIISTTPLMILNGNYQSNILQ